MIPITATHPSIKMPGFDSSDWEEDGERSWDVMRALDYLLSLKYVDAKCILITGLSMGGEITTIAAALEPRFSLVIPASWSPDAGVFYHCNAFISPPHTCGNWVYADNLEYVDTSDYHALIAPRPLIVQTGKLDTVYSTFISPFVGDKAVARRSRIAYGNDVDKFIHYLHYDGHAYHIGEMNGNPDPTALYEQNVRVPNVISPVSLGSLAWQTDPRTDDTNRTVFDFLQAFGCRGSSPSSNRRLTVNVTKRNLKKGVSSQRVRRSFRRSKHKRQ
jgi:Prolyl oligopeptidase family